MHTQRLKCALYGLPLAMGIAFASQAAVVVLQSPEISGGLVAIPVYLVPQDGDQTASLQFDFDFDFTSVAVASIETGASAVQAAKDVMFSQMADGTVRVIVAGMNQDVLGEGVVATVYLERIDRSEANPAVELDSIVLSDPVGNAIETAYENLTIEESPEAASRFAEGVSDETSGVGSTLQSESKAVAESGDGATTASGIWPYDNGAGNQAERDSAANDSTSAEFSRDTHADSGPRSLGGVSGAGIEFSPGFANGVPPGLETSLSRPVSERSVPPSGEGEGSSQASPVSGEAAEHTRGTPEQVAAAAPGHGAMAGTARRAPEAMAVEDSSVSHKDDIMRFWPLLGLPAAILALRAAYRTPFGRNGKTEVRMR